jgi:hypothetical protein
MNVTELNNYCSTYNLNPIEINCIILGWAIDNKFIAFSYTIAHQSKAKNKDVLCNQFYRRESVQRFIQDQRNRFIVNDGISTTNSTNIIDVYAHGEKEDKKDKVYYNGEITSDNIKSLLESEFERTTDPEKRTTLLIKIADFLSLNKTNDEDFQTPLIYLPARCKDCTFKH